MANPVILLHGFTGSSASTWTESGLALLLDEGGRTALPLDLLGHGDRPKPHDPEAYVGLEDDVLDRMPDGQVDGIGFSMGAITLLALAARHPDRFGRLVLGGIGRNVLERDEEQAKRIAAGVAGEAPGEDLQAQMFARYAREDGNDPEALAAFMRRPRGGLQPGELGNITATCLVVIGDQDFAGPGEPLVEALPDARLVTLRGVDHFSLPKQFGFVDETLEFLDAVPG
ncbi:MAG: alpha/beta fold hydrolase [Actinomycetota bacterium]